MRIIILILLFLFAFKSEGQIINASQPYRPTGSAASCSLLLDGYSTAVAVDLRRIRCAYTGSIIRVRRSSDNTEQDISYTSGNDLDTASLKTFVGTNSTDTGFVVKGYDQSGNTRDAIQTTYSRQPIIIQSGVIVRQNTKPSMRYDGDRYLTVTLSSPLAQPNTYFMVAAYSGSGSGGAGHLLDQTGISGTDRNLIGFVGLNLVLYAGDVFTYGANTSSLSLYTAVFNGSSSKVQRNGSSMVTGSAGSQSLGSFNIGKGQGEVNQNAIIGYVSSLIVFNSNQSDNISAIKSNINSYYSIY